ncbi:hypothetical protein AB0I22_27035 [Streptomyces sp. NPDC050610]|uniref:hypothetical protein n=1 Tax=Streptomyces sp. NPDC050610 TaxID=3157097 RepID=UPI00344590A9
MNSDAKILLLYVQGLPESETAKPLGEHAARLGITGRAFQKAKRLLVESGYFHDWRWQTERGRWVTEQVFANVVLSAEEAVRVRDGEPPSVQYPTVGAPSGRSVGGSLRKKKTEEKKSSHPPTEPAVADDPEAALRRKILEPHLAEAERVLLSLRRVDRRLWLGAAEVRELAGAAAEWFLRGARAGELRDALTTGLPPEGVRYAPGFVRRRLADRLPEAPSFAEQQRRSRMDEPPSPPARFATCQGPGSEHVFRPAADETHCGPCRQTRAEAAFSARRAAGAV